MSDLTHEDVDRVEQAHINALLDSDLYALDTLYADDLLHIHIDGRRDDKDIYFNPLRDGDLRFTELEFRGDALVHLLGDSATMTRDMFWKVKLKDGRIAEGLITYTSLWGRRDDAIKQLLWHSTKSVCKL